MEAEDRKKIRYDYELINVRAVMTHVQYDQGKWKE